MYTTTDSIWDHKITHISNISQTRMFPVHVYSRNCRWSMIPSQHLLPTSDFFQSPFKLGSIKKHKSQVLSGRQVTALMVSVCMTTNPFIWGDLCPIQSLPKDVIKTHSFMSLFLFFLNIFFFFFIFHLYTLKVIDQNSNWIKHLYWHQKTFISVWCPLSTLALLLHTYNINIIISRKKKQTCKPI